LIIIIFVTEKKKKKKKKDHTLTRREVNKKKKSEKRGFYFILYGESAKGSEETRGSVCEQTKGEKSVLLLYRFFFFSFSIIPYSDERN